MSTITMDRMEAAMNFLAETDEEYGRARGWLEKTEILRKRTRARVFMTSEGTVAERNALAETHAEVMKADDEYITAIQDYETLRAKRQRADTLIEVWRSVNASQRRAS